MSKVIDQFPNVAGGPLVVIPACEDDKRRSFRAAVARREIPVLVEDKATPNLNWWPGAAVRVAGAPMSRVGDNGAAIMSGEDLSRVAFWLQGYELASGGSTPIDVEWQLRSSSGCTPNVLDRGKIHLTDIGQVGTIVQASGYECDGYELWFRVNSLIAGAEVVKLDLEIRGSRFHGAPRDVWKGSVSI